MVSMYSELIPAVHTAIIFLSLLSKARPPLWFFFCCFCSIFILFRPSVPFLSFISYVHSFRPDVPASGAFYSCCTVPYTLILNYTLSPFYLQVIFLLFSQVFLFFLLEHMYLLCYENRGTIKNKITVKYSHTILFRLIFFEKQSVSLQNI